jgi:dynein heavy chain
MEVDSELIHAEKQLLLLAAGGVGSDMPKPNVAWLTDVSWSRICELEKLKKGPWANFSQNFKTNIRDWTKVFDSDHPMQEHWPGGLKESMTPMQRALVILAVRTDCTVGALQEVIAAKLGRDFLEPPSFNLEKSFADSVPHSPLIFVLSSGADPMGEIVRLGQKLGMAERMQSVSLGQGQGGKASRAIDDGVDTGVWVVLQNCHLATSFMPILETRVEELNPDKVADTFRLWLTAMPSSDFPVSVLQNGLKMTNEPPKGLKSNLLRAYLSFEPSWFNEACGRTEEHQHAFRKMLFGLCFFHSLIQERCSYGPLGWNIQYQFSEPDREICVSQLNMFIEENEHIPYAALRYTAAEANYGGRVTDVNDRRTINYMLTDFYCPDILKDAYKFSPSGTYYAPPFASLDKYVDYIRGLPINQMPEIFGLHANANMSSAIGEALRMLQTACSLQPKVASVDGGKSPDEIMVEASSTFLAALPQLYDTEFCTAKYPVDYNESMNTVLNQELLRFNRLLARIRSMLVDVGRAVKGLVVMTSDLEFVATGILQNATPAVWKSVSYPSLKPLASYVYDLCARLKFLQDWIDEGIPNTFWISGFFFTQSFLTGQQQNFARRVKLPIDMLMWNYQVQSSKTTTFDKEKSGCMVYGLFIEGARWDDTEHVIAESSPKVLFSEIPHIHLIPLEVSKDSTDKKLSYPTPIYKTSERKGTLSTSGHNTNFIMCAMLPISKHHSEKHWTKRGVACLTQLDD